MKKILIVVVIVVLAAAGYYFLRDETSTTSDNQPSTTSNFTRDPSSATFTFDDGSVTLSNGKSEIEVEDSFPEEVTLLDDRAEGDLNGDEQEDVVVLLSRSGSGSGTFIYIGAYVSGPVNYKGTSAVFVGDRISPQNISINNGVVTFEYLDRGLDESFATEPTIEATKQYVYRNDSFEER